MQHERQMIVEGMRLAGIKNAHEIWPSIEKEIDLFGYDDIFNQYRSIWDGPTERQYAYATGALLYEYYVIDEDCGVLPWYIWILQDIFDEGQIDANGLHHYASLFDDDFGLCTIRLIQLLRETAPELDDHIDEAQLELWGYLYQFSSIIYSEWKRNNLSTAESVIDFLDEQKISIGGSENAILFAFFSVVFEEYEEGQFESILGQLDIPAVNRELLIKLKNGDLEIEMGTESDLGQKFIEFCLNKNQ